MAAGITAAVFDNFQMKVIYGGFSVAGVTGTKIEMTNWASVFMPASFMPAGFTCARHTPPRSSPRHLACTPGVHGHPARTHDAAPPAQRTRVTC